MRLFKALCALALLANAGNAWAQAWVPQDVYLLDHSGAVDWSDGGVAPTFMWTLDQAVAATVTPEVGGFALTKNGTPVRVTDGTYPAGISGTQGYGHKLSSGNNWYATDAATGGIMDPAGDFSVCAVVRPTSLAGQNSIISKHATTGDKRGWTLYLVASTGSARLAVSSDGTAGNLTYVGTSSYCVTNRNCFICATYDYKTSGTSIGTVYLDGTTAATSATMKGPAYDGGVQLNVGYADENPATSPMVGVISHIAYWNGTVLTSAQVARLRAQWEGATNGGLTPLTATIATPPAQLQAPPGSGTEPFLVEPPANTARVGAYGLGNSFTLTNLLTYSTFETSAGGGHPTGWTVTETAGDGGAAVDQDTTTSAHSNTSVKFVLTGTTSVGSVASNCVTTGYDVPIGAQVWAKKSAGTSASALYVLAYDQSDCSGATYRVDLRAAADLTTSWAKITGNITTADWGKTNCGGNDCDAYKLVWEETCDGGCTSYVDAAFLRTTGYQVFPDNGCFADTGTPPTCTSTAYTVVVNPLNNLGDWEVQATARSPAASSVSTNTRYVFGSNFGVANSWYGGWGNNLFSCGFYNSAGAATVATVAAVGNADTEYRFACQHNSEGKGRACFNGTCGNWTAAVSMTSAGTALYLGGASVTSSRSETWVRDVQIFRSLVTP